MHLMQNSEKLQKVTLAYISNPLDTLIYHSQHNFFHALNYAQQFRRLWNFEICLLDWKSFLIWQNDAYNIANQSWRNKGGGG